jgi:hypothetical protein
VKPRVVRRQPNHNPHTLPAGNRFGLQVEFSLLSIVIKVTEIHDLDSWAIADNLREIASLNLLEISVVVSRPSLHNSGFFSEQRRKV